MKKLAKFSLFIYFISIFFLLIMNCSIPQILPHLEIPVASINQDIIDSDINLKNLSFYFVCNNNENNFKGYYFFYKDSSNFLNIGHFAYFDKEQNQFVYLNKIPQESEISNFKSIKNFRYYFYLSINSETDSSNYGVRDTYILVDENKNEISQKYEPGKSITLYLIPIGEDVQGIYIYTPAFSTSSNRIILSFK
ncbi:MAG: hypothetical protein ACK4YF_02385 [Exilispira sp.]